MAYLKADIVSATLVDLGVRAIGETAAAGETAEVGTRFDATLSQVVQEAGVTINPAAIATYLHRPLVGYLVRVCAPTFGAEANDELAAAAWDLLIAAVRTGNTAAASVKDQLIEEVLLAVQHLKPGQHASAQDRAYIATRLERSLSDLATRNIVYIASGDDIEEAHVEALIDLLAAKVAPNFGGKADRVMQRDAEARLRTIARIGRGTGTNLEIDPALRSRTRVRSFSNFTNGL